MYALIASVLKLLWTLAIVSVTLLIVAVAAVSLYIRQNTDAEVAAAARAALDDTRDFYSALYFFLVRGGSFDKCPYFPASSDLQARVQVYSLALIFRMWSLPHYRNGTFQDDMSKNLRNVAIPGTGIPLSLFATHKLLAYAFLVFFYPLAAAVSAVHRARVDPMRLDFPGSPIVAFSAFYREQLLRPQDWFSFWRINCRLATAHAYVTGDHGYELEDKLKFIRACEEADVPTTPVLTVPSIICKHRNEEGGLGFQAFANAVAGGDWIIQERLANNASLQALLPRDAPLSTFRVISGSVAGVRELDGGEGEDSSGDITALSCVWRAGRAGAATDHDSILFDVDMASGEIKGGTSNAHWYRLWQKALQTSWLSSHGVEKHPDTGLQISGFSVPQFKRDVLEIVVDAHRRLAPNVPLIGWDVALTKEHGPVLLEGNFSCNFFRGTFDQKRYFEMVGRYFSALDGRIVAKTSGDEKNAKKER